MASPLILVKDVGQNNTSFLDFSKDLAENETIVSATLVQLVPVTNPPLVAAILGIEDGYKVEYATEGGKSNITYNTRLEILTDHARKFSTVVAISVRDYVHADLQTRNPDAYNALVDTLEVGQSAIGKISFSFPAGTDLSNSAVTWQLLDREGLVYSSGNAFDYKIENTSFLSRIEAYGVIHAPSDTPPTLMDQAYQVRWELSGVGPNSSYAFENVKVVRGVTEPTGVEDCVELKGDNAHLAVVLDEAYEEVGVEIFAKDTLVHPWQRAQRTEKTSDGWYYSVDVDTGSFPVSLDAYSVVWRYRNVSTGLSQVNRQYGKLFVVSPLMLAAVEDCRMMVMKARTTLTGFPDVLFDTSTIMSWLRRGRDFFNAASGILTFFNMTRASGALREFWLGYSEVAMLQSQYLAEGEKAFDWSGQAISLNRDVTQYYQQLADSKLSRLDNDVKPFKENLIKKGVDGGDGDIENGTGRSSVGAVGVNVTPVMQYAFRRNYPLWR